MCLERVKEDLHRLPFLWKDNTPILPVEGGVGPAVGDDIGPPVDSAEQPVAVVAIATLAMLRDNPERIERGPDGFLASWRGWPRCLGFRGTSGSNRNVHVPPTAGAERAVPLRVEFGTTVEFDEISSRRGSLAFLGVCNGNVEFQPWPGQRHEGFA